MTLILGIDPGITCTGLAVAEFSARTRRIVECVSVRDTSVGVWENINALCERYEHIPCCGIEAYTYYGPASANKNAMLLAGFVGEIRAHWVHTSIDELIEIRKVEVNRAIGIRSGKAPKARVKRALEALFPGQLGGTNEHERDAAAVAVAAWQRWSVKGRAA